MGFPVSAVAAREELAQGLAAMHRQNPQPPTSFHHTLAPLAFLSHTWKSPGCLKAGDNICMAGSVPRPLCKPPDCEKHKSSYENSVQQ